MLVTHYLIAIAGINDRVAERGEVPRLAAELLLPPPFDSLPSKRVVGGEVAGYITVKLH